MPHKSVLAIGNTQNGATATNDISGSEHSAVNILPATTTFAGCVPNKRNNSKLAEDNAELRLDRDRLLRVVRRHKEAGRADSVAAHRDRIRKRNMSEKEVRHDVWDDAFRPPLYPAVNIYIHIYDVRASFCPCRCWLLLPALCMRNKRCRGRVVHHSLWC